MPVGLIHALAIVKQAAAQVNARHNLDQKIANAIEHAAVAIQSGELDDQFPLVIWQTGSGNQSNMNVNKVITGYANKQLTGTRAGKSPDATNTHVTQSQSANTRHRKSTSLKSR